MTRVRWLLLPILLMLMLSGCAPRIFGGDTAAAAETGGMVLDLPSIVLDVDSTGAVSSEQIPLDLIPGLGDITLPEDIVAAFVSNGNQYLQIETHPNGLVLFLDGKPFFGSVFYDDDVLNTLGPVLEILTASPDDAGDEEAAAEEESEEPDLVESMLPVLRNVGMGVTLRLPLAEGTARRDMPSIRGYKRKTSADMARIKREEQSLRVNEVPIQVAPDGSLSTSNFLVSIMLSQLPPGVGLPESALEGLSERGITSLTLATRPVGLTVGINGNQLPTMLWDSGELDNVLAWGSDSGYLAENVPELSPQVLGIVVPFLTGSPFNIELILPGG